MRWVEKVTPRAADENERIYEVWGMYSINN